MEEEENTTQFNHGLSKQTREEDQRGRFSYKPSIV